MNYYIIRRNNIKTGEITYFLKGHSTFSTKPKLISKYYAWDSEKGVKSAMTRLKNQYDDLDYEWSYIDVQSEDIEVR